MRAMSAKDAKNHFGELLLEAQKAPVTIEKNGRPVAVLLSFEEYEAAERMKLDVVRAMVAEADEAAARGDEAEWTEELTARIRAAGEAILADNKPSRD
ncbi:MAG: type II toxin-antitoxin system prevent-host-death family antitoxin [Geminicoccaceae bacterium]